MSLRVGEENTNKNVNVFKSVLRGSYT